MKNAVARAPRAKRRNTAHTLGWIGAVSLPTNIVLTILRENPLFWTTRGGYPVLLREFVAVFWYPIFIANLVLCVALLVSLVRGFQHTGRSSPVAAALAGMFWFLWFLTAGLAIANNIENLCEGRPLHEHPPHSQAR